MSDRLSRRPGAGAPRDYAFPSRTRVALPSGVSVVAAPIGRLPLVTATVVVKGAGAFSDPADAEGLAELVAAMLLEGTAERDGAAIAEQFEDLGTTVSSAADWDAATLSATLHPDRLDRAVDLLHGVLRSPAFPEREMARLRGEHAAERLQMLAEPRSLADAAFEWLCYSSRSRYRRPISGTRSTVDQLDRAAAVRTWTAQYVPARTTVILVGDIAVDRAVELASRLCDDWPAVEPPPPDAVTEARHEIARVHLVHKPDAAQCELRIGHAAVPRSHPDYFPLTVMNAILGGLFSSRINLNLRERHGYTYGAHSGFDWRSDAGPFVVSTAVNTDAAGAAAREVLAEIERIRTDVVSADELSLATSYLAGVFPLRFETTSAVAAALASAELFGLHDRYFDEYRDSIAAVTRDDVRRVAQEQLRPDVLQIVAVGDRDAVAPQLEALGFGTPTIHAAADVESGR